MAERAKPDKPITRGAPPKAGKSPFAQRLSDARRARGWNQRAFAGMIGVSCTSVVEWENDTNKPRIDVLPEIARRLEVSADWLLGLTDEMERSVH